MKESAYSNELIKRIKAKGIFAYKISDRFHSGIPDIYVAGGNWIESKAITAKSTSNWFDKLTDIQLSTLLSLEKSFDIALVASVWSINKRIWSVIVPFKCLTVKPIWDTSMVIEHGSLLTGKADLVPMFDKNDDRNMDFSWYTKKMEDFGL